MIIGITAISAADNTMTCLTTSTNSQAIIVTTTTNDTLNDCTKDLETDSSQSNIIKDNYNNTKNNTVTKNTKEEKSQQADSQLITPKEYVNNKNTSKNIKVQEPSTKINLQNKNTYTSPTNTSILNSIKTTDYKVNDQNISHVHSTKLASNNVVYVSNSGSDIYGTGTKNHPYRTILKGLQEGSSGSTIKLLGGTYSTLGDTGSITMDKNQAIVGLNNAKISLGDYDSDAFIISKGYTITFKNVIFTNNRARQLITNYGTLIFDNCIFSNNRVISSLYDSVYSGVIDNEYAALYIRNCKFSNNIGNFRGGAIIDRGGLISITNTAFTNNKAIDSNYQDIAVGGAISLWYRGNCTISGCTFIGNSAKQGGAISGYKNHLVIKNSIFKNNKASIDGGAIETLDSPYNLAKPTVKIINTKFISNSASKGGAIATSLSLITVTGSSFKSNTGIGSAIYNYGERSYIKSVNNNYWGSSNPKWSSLLYKVTKPSTLKRSG